MCVLSIKVPKRKKSGNLFNDPRVYIYIYISLKSYSLDMNVTPLNKETNSLTSISKQ